MEAANLRDAVMKLQTLNDGLSQDKEELNKMLMRVMETDTSGEV